MEASAGKDTRSFEYSSPSELDRRFFEEQSLLAALSLEQLSISRASNDADNDDCRLSVRASLCLSLDAVSPPQFFSTSGIGAPEAESGLLTLPPQGKFSTPQVLLHKQKMAACFDQLYNDLTAAQMSWDVSLIKPDSNSPKPGLELSATEPTWSPKPKPTQPSEVSP